MSEDASQGEQTQAARYDHLFNPNHDMSRPVADEAGGLAVAGAMGVEAAAVRTSAYDPMANYVNRMPPPTDQQIANAKKHGFDLALSEKYYSKDSWARRNDGVK